MHRLADHGELRNQVIGRRWPMRLVFGVELVAEGDFRLVEDNGEVRRAVVLRHIPQQLPQHVAEAEHGIDLQPVGFAVERRQRVISAENVGRAIHQKDVVAFRGGFGGGELGGRYGILGHGGNLGILAAL